MLEARAVKTQIQIKYKPILDLGSVARKVMGTYAAFTNTPQVQNQNQVDERIILPVPEEKYFLDCTWERIAFVGQGSRSSYRDPDGKLRFFFELLEDVEALDIFTEFRSLSLLCFDVIPLENSEESDTPSESIQSVVKAFPAKYLTNERPHMPGSFTDVGMTQESEEGNFKIASTFGPFRPEKDIENAGLPFPRRGAPEPDWAVLPSLFTRTEVTYSGIDVDRETYHECDDKRVQILEQLADSSSSLLNHGD